jgi:hypothetical protein
MVECPEQFEECFTPEEYEELLILFAENDMAMPESMGDAEAATQFAWEILFLTPWELAYIALPMGVLAFYGLTIYAIFKRIQKKYE